MDFSEALKAMKEGKSAMRKGSTRYFWVNDGTIFMGDKFPSRRDICSHFSIGEVLAEDWEIVE